MCRAFRTIENEVRAAGLIILDHRQKNHHVLRLARADRPDGPCRSLTIGVSSSDHRALKNNVTHLRRIAKELLQ